MSPTAQEFATAAEQPAVTTTTPLATPVPVPDQAALSSTATPVVHESVIPPVPPVE